MLKGGRLRLILSMNSQVRRSQIFTDKPPYEIVTACLTWTLVIEL